ncbi:Mur ligase family protein [Bradyrhizobium ganzhouense]|uniref:Mur ligase family protein n=1 Tax=Bradyrhizobium ganzhouense TaxID=1179767 RepID=UPI003CEA2941
MNIANIILLDSEGVRVVRAGDIYTVRGALCVRIEPAFVFQEGTLSISVSSPNEEKICSVVHKVSRDTIAVFEAIPATRLGLHTVEICLNEKSIVNFSINIGKEATKIVSAAFRERNQSSFYRNRYRLQAIPFESMFRETHEVVRRKGASLIFVTGSVGKTTTKELLSWLLKPLRDLIHSTDSWNFPHEICSQIHNNSSWCSLFVMEAALGAHLGLMGKLLPPDVLVFTSVGKVHTSFSQDLQQIADQKAMLATHMSDGSTIVANFDNEFIRRAVEKQKVVSERRVNVLRTSTNESSDADIIAMESDGKIVVVDKPRAIRIECILKSDVLIPPNVIGCAYGAWRVMAGDECPANEFADRLAEFPGAPGRLERIELANVTVVNDAYNSNPLSMRRFISHLALERSIGRRVLAVVGEMRDLGPLTHNEHAAIVAEVCNAADKVIFVGDLFKTVDLSSTVEWLSLDDLGVLDDKLSALVGEYDVFGFKGSYATGLFHLANGFIAKHANALAMQT